MIFCVILFFQFPTKKIPLQALLTFGMQALRANCWAGCACFLFETHMRMRPSFLGPIALHCDPEGGVGTSMVVGPYGVDPRIISEDLHYHVF